MLQRLEDSEWKASESPKTILKENVPSEPVIKLVRDPKLEKKASEAEKARAYLEIENSKLQDKLVLSEN